jgi:uncharacterized protein (DUF2344 family)
MSSSTHCKLHGSDPDYGCPYCKDTEIARLRSVVQEYIYSVHALEDENEALREKVEKIEGAINTAALMDIDAEAIQKTIQQILTKEEIILRETRSERYAQEIVSLRNKVERAREILRDDGLTLAGRFYQLNQILTGEDK